LPLVLSGARVNTFATVAFALRYLFPLIWAFVATRWRCFFHASEFVCNTNMQHKFIAQNYKKLAVNKIKKDTLYINTHEWRRL
jgi:hypothetical protein